VLNGRRFETPAGGPLNSREVAPIIADAGIPFARLDAMAATVSPEAPWAAAQAAEWDAMTVESWTRQSTLTDFGRFWIDLLIFLVASADASDISLLHLAGYLARLGDGKRPGGTREALDFLFLSDLAEGGLLQTPDRLAARLGRRVVLGAPVRRIVQRNGRVRVEADGLSVLAKRVIVATAPSLNALIDFQPGLPELPPQLL